MTEQTIISLHVEADLAPTKPLPWRPDAAFDMSDPDEGYVESLDPTLYHVEATGYVVSHLAEDGTFTVLEHGVFDAAQRGERAVLEQLGDLLGRYAEATLVTFAGRAFGLPLVQARFMAHAMPAPALLLTASQDDKRHLDLALMLGGAETPLFGRLAAVMAVPAHEPPVTDSVKEQARAVVEHSQANAYSQVLLHLRLLLWHRQISGDEHAAALGVVQAALLEAERARLLP